MKHLSNILAFVLVLGLLSGCGGANPDAAYAENADSAAAFGAELTSPAQVSVLPETEAAAQEPTGTSPAEHPQEAGVSEAEQVDLTEQAVISVCYALSEGSRYDPEDPICFWRAVGYLLILAGNNAPGAVEDGEILRIPAESVDLFVRAVFRDAPAQYPSLGEENPLLSWEAAEDGEYYLVPRRDLGTLTVDYTEDGTAASLYRDGDLMGTYRLELDDYPAGAGRKLFSQCVVAATDADLLT